MKLKKVLGIISVTLCLLITLTGCSTKSENQNSTELNLSVAISLKEAMIKIEEEYKKINEDISLVINYGGSGSLQSQIEQGAPCDVFISAGTEQMDKLDKGGFLLEGSNKDLLENKLVIISKKNSNISSIEDLNSNKVVHIGIGEPSSVPAGKYADEFLTNSNLKGKIKDKLVYAKDVKEVLAWTKSSNTEAGFVYYSDTINDDSIKIIENIPTDYHSRIIYPIAVIKSSKKTKEAKAFEDFLLSEKGQGIIKEFGYESIK